MRQGRFGSHGLRFVEAMLPGSRPDAVGCITETLKQLTELVRQQQE